MLLRPLLIPLLVNRSYIKQKQFYPTINQNQLTDQIKLKQIFHQIDNHKTKMEQQNEVQIISQTSSSSRPPSDDALVVQVVTGAASVYATSLVISEQDNIECCLSTQMESPKHRKKAMSSEKASVVKKAGHSNEDDFAALIGGVVVKGHTKPDVVKNDIGFSLKKVCKRIQFALYSRNSTNWAQGSESAQICKDLLTIYPPTFEEYKTNKQNTKQQLRTKMLLLKEHLATNPENLREYLSLVMTNHGEVEYLVMRDRDDKQYIFNANEAIDTIVKNAIVANSQSRKAGDTPEQKTLITIPNKNETRYVNLMELETRNSSPGHYAEFLCVCNRDPLFDLLVKHITEEQVFKEKMIVRGSAINNFETRFVQ